MEKLEQPAAIDEFPFPFKPYDIQLEFMKSLYGTLENGKLGIFESPTGTGKSLSIICGAIKWLKDHTNTEKHNISDSIALLESEKAKLNADTKDWFASQTKELEIIQKLNRLKLEQKKIEGYFERIKKITNNDEIKVYKKNLFKIKKGNKEKCNTNESNIQDFVEESKIVEENDILLDEYSEQSDHLDDKLSDEEENEEKYNPTQIFIASRTHSQLNQFVGEIKKSPYGDQIRVTSLASRQNYCINPDVKRLKSMALINDRCLDMQKKSTSKKTKTDQDGRASKKQRSLSCQCPYFKQSAIEDLRDYALSGVHDIEDLVVAGQELGACPYYASRKAAADSEIILIPYNTLLHKSTREASGVDLKNSAIIIDEAHNLLEAIAQMYSSEVSYNHLYYALEQLKCYKKRYSTMFSAANLLKINKLIFVIKRLFQMIDKTVNEDYTQIFTLENFAITAEIENYNIFELVKFCKESKIAQKVRSYSVKYPLQEEIIKSTEKNKGGVKDFLASIEKKNENTLNTDNLQEKEKSQLVHNIPNNPLLSVITFLESQTYLYDDGRILLTLSTDENNNKLQFLLLNASSNFTEIVQKAKSVIVAGGTMKPNSEFRNRLFINAGATEDRIIEFSCDHIIPPDNILPIVMTKGPKNDNLRFDFYSRMSMGPLVKDILLKTCKSVRGGVVVFFSSYKYENWIWDQVKSVDFGRQVFREPQTTSGVDLVLEKYTNVIKSSTVGAMLFSVVGGKLSEGLNFSDDLGRCVIVVGLPYANIMAADLKEKMSYLDKKEGIGAGQKFYENLCMKSVNQCIGRAVRHRNDYATVLLLDERYNRSATKNALPDWIKRSLRVCDFNEAFDSIREFLQEKKTNHLRNKI